MSEALVHGPAGARELPRELTLGGGHGVARPGPREEEPLRRAPRSAYIPTLDGWRAIAVALVVFSHRVGSHEEWRDVMGGMGVSVFFGISGYLICTRLLEEEARAGAIGLRRFYIRRAFRILPPAFAYLAIVAALGAFHLLAVTPLEVTGAALFFRNYVPGNWYTSHFWSLAVEEHFYLFFPALLIAAGRRRTAWAALILSLGGACWRVVDTHYGVLSRHLAAGVYSGARTDFRLDGLLLACLAAILFFNRTPELPRRVVVTVPWVAALVLVADTFGIVPLPEVLKAVVIVLMLLSSVWAPWSLLSRALELGPVRWVGRLSYSLYLWQQFFFVKYPVNDVPALRWLQRLPLSLVALFAAAAASYYLLERPMLKIGHRLGKSPVPGR